MSSKPGAHPHAPVQLIRGGVQEEGLFEAAKQEVQRHRRQALVHHHLAGHDKAHHNVRFIHQHRVYRHTRARPTETSAWHAINEVLKGSGGASLSAGTLRPAHGTPSTKFSAALAERARLLESALHRLQGARPGPAAPGSRPRARRQG